MYFLIMKDNRFFLFKNYGNIMCSKYLVGYFNIFILSLILEVNFKKRFLKKYGNTSTAFINLS